MLHKIFGHTGVGIEITPTRVYVVELQTPGDNLKTIAFSTPLSEKWFTDGQPQDYNAIAKVIKSLKIKARVASAIPAKDVMICNVACDSLNESKLLSKSGMYFSQPAEDLDIECLQVSSSYNNVSYLLAGLEKTVTDSYVKTFKLSGLRLDFLEASFFSLTRAFQDTLERYSEKVIAIVNLKEQYTEVAIAKNNIPHSLRTIPLGTAKETVEHLLDEIQYFLAENPVSKVFQTGCNSADENFHHKLQEKLWQKFLVRCTAFNLIKYSVPPGFEVAFGLALQKLLD